MSYKLTQTGQRVQELLDQIANGGQLQVTDAVLYTEQVLNENEQKQARKNIGAAAENQIPTGAVLYSQQQNLTGDQQAQARTNIGVPTKVSELENDAHYITENQVPVALPQKTGAIQSGVLPTTGWDILDEVGDEGWKENILPVSSDWDSVTYGDGKFVAVADGSANGIYSLDGVTWTEFTLPASRNWYSVTYGGGKFVAVADGTYGAYSTDGINWTEMTMPASRRWESVTYGNSQYVAIAYSSTYGAYSTDGINWTEMTMPADSEWESVIYGDGKFVAVAYDLYGAYSTDGINWTKMAMPSYHHWISVTYGNGKYIAVPYNNTSGAYSTDGINWTEFTLPIEGTWRVVYGNKKFVAVAERSSVCAYSTNGLTWTEMTMPANRGWYSVAYGDGKFVALAYDITFGAYWEVAGIPIYTISDTDITANSDILMELTDEGGARARTIASGSIQIIRGTVPTNPIPYTYKVKQTNASGQFTVLNHFVPNIPVTSVNGQTGAVTIAVPTKTSQLTNDSNFATTEDIPTSLPVTYKKVSGELPTSGWGTPDEGWKETTLPASRDWGSVVYADGKYVATANNSDKGAYSTDGINWTEMSMPASRKWCCVTYGNGKFVAIADQTDKGAYSADGITWTEMSMPASRGWRTITYGNGKFVAMEIGSDKGAYSTDGITWTEFTLPATRNWINVTYGDGKFVAMAYNQYGAYSTDGINWVEMTLPVNTYWAAVTYGNGKFVAVASNSSSGAYSVDGINWTETTLPASAVWGGVTYGNGKFVTVAFNSDKSAYSTDGINWTETSMPVAGRWQIPIYGNEKFVVMLNNSDKGAYWKAVASSSTGKTYSITDTFITANTSVKMYLTDAGGVKAQSKSSGSITVIRDTVPTTSIPYKYEVEQTSNEGLFEVINSYVPSASPSIISKTITNTSSNISITGTSEPYLCTITDSDVTTTNFVRLYPLDEGTETWLNDNTSSSIITESSGKFTFKVTTNTLPQTFTMKYFIQ